MDKGVTVVGAGAANGPRDTCTLGLGAEARAGTAEAALAQAGVCLSRMRTALLAAGVTEHALATEGVSLNPVYDDYPTVSGYTASLGLRVRVDAVGDVGALLGDVVRAGGDGARVQSVVFSHAHPAVLEDAAREAAMADARGKAERLAGLAGRELGEAVSIEEVSGLGPVPRPMMAKMSLADAAPMPVDAGESAVTVSVRVRWALV
jgi:uncharacterized protein YggE